MNRRNFLKICAVTLGGLISAKLLGWLSFSENKSSGLKEARFYKSADHLAG